LDGTTVKGLRFVHRTRNYEVLVTEEVVVSCGVVGSPQLLELSGIGDTQVLKAAGVECLVENRGVGANFQDHVMSAVGYEMAPGSMSLDSLQKPEILQEQEKIYMESQTGAIAAGLSCMGFLSYSSLVTEQELAETVATIKSTNTKTPFHKKQLEQVIAHLESHKSANIQIILIPARIDLEEGVLDQSKLLSGPKEGEYDCIIVAMCLEYPASRGSIHIASLDPLRQPVINSACEFFCLHGVN
jgi:choline dehydrogenase-like flavoprotein